MTRVRDDKTWERLYVEWDVELDPTVGYDIYDLNIKKEVKAFDDFIDLHYKYMDILDKEWHKVFSNYYKAGYLSEEEMIKAYREAISVSYNEVNLRIQELEIKLVKDEK